ncbi:PROPROTEIN CONVERTASE SUBTILISIN/KEXIN [Salix koriyanagi]|uniref:PROPROTEIN CONVERTASE SUBTILISIN/KEXIN n=1 Tax=Salix koriyanagi TaxID=2511006 RepID=A0A9Q0TSF7_9ROSI|nr:PROPROTEIN CONVERTASE SUBTILISIN/KEXIN [Salix koriyanagi]
MASFWSPGILLVLLLAFLLKTLPLVILAKSNVYIVYMGDKIHDEPELVQESHHELLSDIVGSIEAAKESILYSYKHGFSGFAAVLTSSQAKLIADFPGVVGVVRNRILSSHTTRSWDFLHIKPQVVGGILSKGHSGAGSVIGVMDTGVWPESESFRDEGMSEVPSRWRGICQEGEGFNRSHCNRKIIGARWYIKGYEAEFGKLNVSDGVEFLSPRDAAGHGTHTSSTATGGLVENASFMGLAQGLARGGAPSAWLAVYKVCWATGDCAEADLLAAFDDAIFDGVDVLSVSIGSPPPLAAYVEDAIAIGSFHAVAKGISVICSAGNSGPYPQTVINTAPWIVTVAASTIDRAFPTVITLGNNQTIVGQALFTGKNADTFHPIVYGEDIVADNSYEDSARSCDSGSLNATLARGKTFPSIQVDLAIGTYLLTYMEASRNPVVKFSFTKTVIGQQISPEIAFFSSRGPSSISPTVLKPDIAAPGVNILASWSPAASPAMTGKEILPLDFQIESGTSMSCPHISGIVALLKATHPTWSPAAIKSALITTASIEDEYGQNTVAEGAPHKQADPFDYGGGHVDPNKAMRPGLIFDMGTSDYIRFLCALGYNNSAISFMTRSRTRCRKSSSFLVNLNLPAIAIPGLKKNLTVSRTVTNVGPVTSLYVARVVAPPGTYVTVEPSVLSFDSTTKKIKFKVTFCSQLRIQGRYSFGNLFWEDGFHLVRMPLVVRAVIDDFYAET